MPTKIKINGKEISRGHFLKIIGITTVGLSYSGIASFKSKSVSIVLDNKDPIAGSPQVLWAMGELKEMLTNRGVVVNIYEQVTQAPTEDLCILLAGLSSAITQELLKAANADVEAVPESLGLVPAKSSGHSVLLACGHDGRGLTYAVLELADRVRYADQPIASLNMEKPIIERPANAIRSINRLFVSNIADKPWYNDRKMWPAYLTMLATQRFNRFNLSLGIGYDHLNHVKDAYFLFAYPFLLSVPGYHVHVPGLKDTERDMNLEMLQFISEQTVRRGMQFQLGLWMHGYKWLNSPDPNYTIQGLTPENHAPYCRDAVRALLKACPAISGITFRVHGESGVKEGSYDFWKTVFDGVKTCGRKVEIDMHAKGTDPELIGVAVNTGMPVVLSPKYWAEHMGMPYQQADIRELEKVSPNDKKTSGLLNLSLGSRKFMRYGYGDLLKKDRPYKVLYRIWPGTQKFLLWGDPLTAAAHAKAFSFCGSAGFELMEPLSFKGRRGSAAGKGRCAYADTSLNPSGWDWEKYLYTVRVFGRLQYNPDTAPDVWRRFQHQHFNTGALAAESALANTSRILPIILTTHDPSAGNNNYWPEISTHLPIVSPNQQTSRQYYDTPSPKVFGNVSTLDPQLFLNINDFAEELLQEKRSGKYTPLEAAQWMEDYAKEAARQLSMAKSKISKNTRAFRTLSIDVSVQALLGEFYGAKFRAAVLYRIFEKSGDRKALEEALKMYRAARDFWAALSNQTKGVYTQDITYGELPYQRGHWLDRLPAIEDDLMEMTRKLQQIKNIKSDHSIVKGDVTPAIREALGRPQRESIPCHHIPADSFHAGDEINLELTFDRMPKSALLYYRHVNQAERYNSLEMKAFGNRYQATIPSDYTQSPYCLQYYFELRQGPEKAILYPGFNSELTNQPYFAVVQI